MLPHIKLPILLSCLCFIICKHVLSHIYLITFQFSTISINVLLSFTSKIRLSIFPPLNGSLPKYFLPFFAFALSVHCQLVFRSNHMAVPSVVPYRRSQRTRDIWFYYFTSILWSHSKFLSKEY
ncbi:hypothetical protein CDL12_23193 [Handroanthus impetiginosus]|uniref:Uncharacterized protein n=1 Tax=Handroanthus impetiginosus TaxID=429701 RepID=A0A2G9GG53_9LAMI|nr:hypothetical protein CDL12_23193 [Handroanthus impetiginosus]